jgi:hypothetical protein
MHVPQHNIGVLWWQGDSWAVILGGLGCAVILMLTAVLVAVAGHTSHDVTQRRCVAVQSGNTLFVDLCLFWTAVHNGVSSLCHMVAYACCFGLCIWHCPACARCHIACLLDFRSCASCLCPAYITCKWIR